MKNQIRGQIEERGHGYSGTYFLGNHYIECYIVKDGSCMAKKRIEIPIARGDFGEDSQQLYLSIIVNFGRVTLLFECNNYLLEVVCSIALIFVALLFGNLQDLQQILSKLEDLLEKAKRDFIKMIHSSAFPHLPIFMELK